MSQEIVKITSKGQLTIPVKIRSESNLREGDRIYLKSIGDFVIMKKVDGLTIDEISRVLQEVAKDKVLTRLLLRRESEGVRRKLWKKKYGRSKSPS